MSIGVLILSFFPFTKFQDIIQPNHDQVTAVAKDQTLKITPNMKLVR